MRVRRLRTSVADVADVADVREVPDLAPLLFDVLSFLKRFVVFPSEEAAVAVALWVVHCYVVEDFDSTPRLHLSSATMQSGKTRCLEVIELLVPEPVRVVSPSPAGIFRPLQTGMKTFLIDEADLSIGRESAKESSDLRMILNQGHRAGGGVMRMDGATYVPTKYSTFAPVALAGLGEIPPTIADRSIRIRMRRREESEVVERLRYRLVGPDVVDLRSRLEAWASSASGQFVDAEPPMPEELSDRAQDAAEPLIAIADAAGGEWPVWARNALVTLHVDGEEARATPGELLLRQMKRVFEELGGSFLQTTVIIDQLGQYDPLDGLPAEIDSRTLARLLGEFGIRPTQNRQNGQGLRRGYKRAGFEGPWRRYVK